MDLGLASDESLFNWFAGEESCNIYLDLSQDGRRISSSHQMRIYSINSKAMNGGIFIRISAETVGGSQTRIRQVPYSTDSQAMNHAIFIGILSVMVDESQTRIRQFLIQQICRRWIIQLSGYLPRWQADLKLASDKSLFNLFTKANHSTYLHSGKTILGSLLRRQANLRLASDESLINLFAKANIQYILAEANLEHTS